MTKRRDKVRKLSKRASETCEQTLYRQKQNRIHMATMRASRTFEQTDLTVDEITVGHRTFSELCGTCPNKNRYVLPNCPNDECTCVRTRMRNRSAKPGCEVSTWLYC